MNKEECRQTFDEWLTPKGAGGSLKNVSLYGLLISQKGKRHSMRKTDKRETSLFWASVDGWLHKLESQRRRKNFEDEGGGS